MLQPDLKSVTHFFKTGWPDLKWATGYFKSIIYVAMY